MIKFNKEYSQLKELGFVLKLLYDKQITYSNYESVDKSDVWIRKAGGGLITFDGFNMSTSSSILSYLIDHDFEISFYGIYYDVRTLEVNELSKGDDWFGHINSTGDKIRIYLRSGTINTLRSLWTRRLLSNS